MGRVCGLYAPAENVPRTRTRWKRCCVPFKLFDYTNDDHIDASELKRVVTSMGEKLTLEEADQMIRVADLDKDGRINYKGMFCLSSHQC